MEVTPDIIDTVEQKTEMTTHADPINNDDYNRTLRTYRYADANHDFSGSVSLFPISSTKNENLKNLMRDLLTLYKNHIYTNSPANTVALLNETSGFNTSILTQGPENEILKRLTGYEWEVLKTDIPETTLDENPNPNYKHIYISNKLVKNNDADRNPEYEPMNTVFHYKCTRINNEKAQSEPNVVYNQSIGEIFFSKILKDINSVSFVTDTLDNNFILNIADTESEKTIYLINSREVLHDPAWKPNPGDYVSQLQNKHTKLTIALENTQEPIVYNHPNRPDYGSPYITLEPIQYNIGTSSFAQQLNANMYYDTSEVAPRLTYISSSTKTNADNITVLNSNTINDVKMYLFNNSPNSEVIPSAFRKLAYCAFSAKRYGDQLQASSCVPMDNVNPRQYIYNKTYFECPTDINTLKNLTPEMIATGAPIQFSEGGLPPPPVFLLTGDRTLLAYSLMIGANVIFFSKQETETVPRSAYVYINTNDPLLELDENIIAKHVFHSHIKKNITEIIEKYEICVDALSSLYDVMLKTIVLISNMIKISSSASPSLSSPPHHKKIKLIVKYILILISLLHKFNMYVNKKDLKYLNSNTKTSLDKPDINYMRLKNTYNSIEKFITTFYDFFGIIDRTIHPMNILIIAFLKCVRIDKDHILDTMKDDIDIFLYNNTKQYSYLNTCKDYKYINNTYINLNKLNNYKFKSDSEMNLQECKFIIEQINNGIIISDIINKKLINEDITCEIDTSTSLLSSSYESFITRFDIALKQLLDEPIQNNIDTNMFKIELIQTLVTVFSSNIAYWNQLLSSTSTNRNTIQILNSLNTIFNQTLTEITTTTTTPLPTPSTEPIIVNPMYNFNTSIISLIVTMTNITSTIDSENNSIRIGNLTINYPINKPLLYDSTTSQIINNVIPRKKIKLQPQLSESTTSSYSSSTKYITSSSPSMSQKKSSLYPTTPSSSSSPSMSQKKSSLYPTTPSSSSPTMSQKKSSIYPTTPSSSSSSPTMLQKSKGTKKQTGGGIILENGKIGIEYPGVTIPNIIISFLVQSANSMYVLNSMITNFKLDLHNEPLGEPVMLEYYQKPNNISNEPDIFTYTNYTKLSLSMLLERCMYPKAFTPVVVGNENEWSYRNMLPNLNLYSECNPYIPFYILASAFRETYNEYEMDEKEYNYEDDLLFLTTLTELFNFMHSCVQLIYQTANRELQEVNVANKEHVFEIYIKLNNRLTCLGMFFTYFLLTSCHDTEQANVLYYKSDENKNHTLFKMSAGKYISRCFGTIFIRDPYVHKNSLMFLSNYTIFTSNDNVHYPSVPMVSHLFDIINKNYNSELPKKTNEINVENILSFPDNLIMKSSEQSTNYDYMSYLLMSYIVGYTTDFEVIKQTIIPSVNDIIDISEFLRQSNIEPSAYKLCWEDYPELMFTIDYESKSIYAVYAATTTARDTDIVHNATYPEIYLDEYLINKNTLDGYFEFSKENYKNSHSIYKNINYYGNTYYRNFITKQTDTRIPNEVSFFENLDVLFLFIFEFLTHITPESQQFIISPVVLSENTSKLISIQNNFRKLSDSYNTDLQPAFNYIQRTNEMLYDRFSDFEKNITLINDLLGRYIQEANTQQTELEQKWSNLIQYSSVELEDGLEEELPSAEVEEKEPEVAKGNEVYGKTTPSPRMTTRSMSKKRSQKVSTEPLQLFDYFPPPPPPSSTVTTPIKRTRSITQGEEPPSTELSYNPPPPPPPPPSSPGQFLVTPTKTGKSEYVEMTPRTEGRVKRVLDYLLPSLSTKAESEMNIPKSDTLDNVDTSEITKRQKPYESTYETSPFSIFPQERPSWVKTGGSKSRPRKTKRINSRRRRNAKFNKTKKYSKRSSSGRKTKKNNRKNHKFNYTRHR